jgi:hypothetical protein
VIAFGVLATGASCLIINYGEYLTDEVARKMHGSTVTGRDDGERVVNEKVVENDSNNVSAAYIGEGRNNI